MASIHKTIAKHIHPVLKKNGFENRRGWWRLDTGTFLFFFSANASKLGQEHTCLTMHVGAFSCEIEELYNQRGPIGFTMDDMPGGLMFCHFGSDFWSMDDDMSWNLQRARNLFFPRDVDVSAEIADIAARLERMLPRLVNHFSSVETIVEYTMNGWGLASTSTVNRIQAAAGYVVLGKYDEAEKVMRESLKKGSAPLLYKISDRLRKIIEERRAVESRGG